MCVCGGGGTLDISTVAVYELLSGTTANTHAIIVFQQTGGMFRVHSCLLILNSNSKGVTI